MLQRLSRRLGSVFLNRRRSNTTDQADELGTLSINEALLVDLSVENEDTAGSSKHGLDPSLQRTAVDDAAQRSALPLLPPEGPVHGGAPPDALLPSTDSAKGIVLAPTVTLVDDILVMIFRQLTACQQMDKYDRDYAATPFRLAAVSKQWRDVALATSTIWSHLYLPCGAGRRGNYELYVELILRRSHSVPLHVLLFDCDESSLATDARALQTVMAAAARWRAITMTGKPLKWTHWRSILHCETPILEYAYVFGDEPQDSEDRAAEWFPEQEDIALLPNAPMLQNFEVSWVPVLCAALTRAPSYWTGPGGSSLTCMRLFLLNAQTERLHELLRALPSLVELCLAVLQLGLNVNPWAAAQSYELPVLTHLDLRGIAPLLFVPTSRRIAAPRLDSVTLQREGIMPLTFFFKADDGANAQAITGLTLLGGVARVTGADVRQLRLLERVQSVALDCPMADALFDDMAADAASLWPALHTMHVDRALESDAVRHSLLRFIAAKNAAAQEDHNVATFQHVCVNEDTWLTRELETTFGSQQDEVAVYGG